MDLVGNGREDGRLDRFCETTLRLTFIFQRQHYECLEPGPTLRFPLGCSRRSCKLPGENGTDPDDEAIHGCFLGVGIIAYHCIDMGKWAH